MTASTMTSQPETVAHVNSAILGPLTVPEKEILHFSEGLLGLADHRAFALLPAEPEGLYWLQALEDESLTFLLVDPFPHFPDYSVDVPDAVLTELDATGNEDVLVLALVTLPGSPRQPPTANLQGPLLFNLRARIGKQMVVPETEFGVRCAFRLPEASS